MKIAMMLPLLWTMRFATQPGSTENPQHGHARRNRGIRFSEPEWEEVKQAALARELTPAELVRDMILALVRAPSHPASAAFTPHLIPVIERAFRHAFILATRMRDDMTDAGDQGKLDELINETRKLQFSVLKKPSQSTHQVPAAALAPTIVVENASRRPPQCLRI